MALNAKDIELLNGLIDKVASSRTVAEAAAYYGLGKHGGQKLSVTINTLRQLGVAVPKRMSRGEAMKREWQEFCEWKRRRDAAQATQTLLRLNANGEYRTVV